MAEQKQFPIMLEGYGEGSRTGIPWAVIEGHERQAQENHGRQSLAHLASRGGLSPCEAVAVLEDRRWQRMTEADALAQLTALVAAHESDNDR